VVFPGDAALDGALCVVRGANADGDEWAVVGAYAPNLQVETKKDGPFLRETFDEAVFALLEGLASLRTVALVGDLNLLWQSTAKGQHGEMRERWKKRLQNLGFGYPLDRPVDGKVVPTHRAWLRANRRAPPDARVDFLFVRDSRGRDAAVADFGRHGRFWQRDAWPAKHPVEQISSRRFVAKSPHDKSRRSQFSRADPATANFYVTLPNDLDGDTFTTPATDHMPTLVVPVPKGARAGQTVEVERYPDMPKISEHTPLWLRLRVG